MSKTLGKSAPVAGVGEPRPLALGLAAAKANLIPGLVLWVVALLIVLSYYFWPRTADVFAAVGSWKTEYGFLFSAISTAIWGGLLPFVFQKLQVGNVPPAPWSQLPFMAAYWAFRGVEVDALYRFQAFLFGDQATVGVIVPKVLVDQFIYCPVWCIPMMVLVYLWKDCGYSWKRTRARLGPRWYYRRVVPIMISNWAVWIPAVALIYLLPQPLQLPLQNLVACFWVLLLMVLTGDDRREPMDRGGLENR